MAMGIVNDSDFNAEVERLNQRSVEHVQTKKGRGNVNEVPQSLRKVISEEKINGTPAKELAEIFDVSPSSVSAYAKGATSTASYNSGDKDLRNHNNRVRDIIVKKARKRLLNAMDHITDDKLKDAKLRDLASISTAMASVIDKVEQKDDAQVKIDKLMIYAPRMREEQSYDVIEVRE